jgi:hypothetical protein
MSHEQRDILPFKTVFCSIKILKLQCPGMKACIIGRTSLRPLIFEAGFANSQATRSPVNTVELFSDKT